MNIPATTSIAFLRSDAWVRRAQPMDANGRLPTCWCRCRRSGRATNLTASFAGIIAGKVGGYCEIRLVPGCDHDPHLQPRPMCVRDPRW
jgi:hypothetical protein